MKKVFCWVLLIAGTGLFVWGKMLGDRGGEAWLHTSLVIAGFMSVTVAIIAARLIRV